MIRCFTLSFYVDYAKDSTSAMYKTVMRNNVNAIEQAFDIKAFKKKTLP